MTTETQFHPVHNCFDGVFNTVSGKRIDIVEPTADMIDINDIANALSKICRFGGHIENFYSVAQHSVLVAALAPDELKKEALLHDAAEAYVGDVIKPLKVLLGDGYDNIEQSFNMAIAEKFGLDPVKLLQVKQYDKEALELEHEYFRKGNSKPMVEALYVADKGISLLYAWDHKEASFAFKKSYAENFSIDLAKIKW